MNQGTTPAKPRGLAGLRALYHEYPRQYWILVGSSFIDRLGGALLFPFFTLYITRKFDVGMTQAGVILGIFSISGLFSSLLGGALADRLGRKGLMIFGLVMSASSTLVMGFIDRYEVFMVAAVFIGLLSDVGSPAQAAMIADLLPEKKRAQGYGIFRVVFNLAVVIGPMLGGFLAARSYLLLFIIDAVASTITAIIFALTIKETMKPKVEGEPQESLRQSFSGYLHVLRDSLFTWFLAATLISVLVYMQMNTTLAVFLRDTYQVNEQMFGYILSLNAIMVVLFQFPITRWIEKFRPMLVMVWGTLLYAIGFGLYGFVDTYPFFLFAMVIITIGEMLVSPVSQSIVSTMAPEDMRGRYMATFGFSWNFPYIFGGVVSGLVLDNMDPRLLWYFAGGLGLVATLMFYLLGRRIDRARFDSADARLDIIENLELGRITAEEAASQFKKIKENRWSALAKPIVKGAGSEVHIRVSDQPANITRKELVLPMGLVSTILNTDCRLTVDLEAGLYDHRIRQMITQSLGGADTVSRDETAGSQVEVVTRAIEPPSDDE
ncbi:MAG: MFS transporter [Anaerolineae bacterium]|nr:MFS transporter [Anaerolineae bacterium]